MDSSLLHSSGASLEGGAVSDGKRLVELMNKDREEVVEIVNLTRKCVCRQKNCAKNVSKICLYFSRRVDLVGHFKF